MSAKVMDYEAIKELLDRAKEPFPRLSHLWLDAGYSGEDKGGDYWVEKKTLGGGRWRSSGDRAQACSRGGADGVGLKQWAKEGVTVDWHKLLPPQGFTVLPRRWVVERTFAWISHNRRMSLGITSG